MILYTKKKQCNYTYCRAFKIKLDCPLAHFFFIYFDYIYCFHNDKKLSFIKLNIAIEKESIIKKINYLYCRQYNYFCLLFLAEIIGS